MTETEVRLFADIMAALTPLLPGDPPQVIERAAQAVLLETGRPVPGFRPGRITAPQGCNLRAFDQTVIGTIKTNIAIELGQAEGDWTPIRLQAWVGKAMAKADD